MSLSLDLGTRPAGTVARIDCNSQFVEIGKDLEISMDDFCQLAMYVLTNTDLRSADPRLHFMNQLAKLNVIEGYNPGGARLG